MTFTFGSAPDCSRNRTESLCVVFYASALLLLSLSSVVGLSGCGGGQHGLGAGVSSGPTPTTPTAGSNSTPVITASAVNSSTNMVYVVNSGNSQNATGGTFYAISGASNSVVSSLPGLSIPVAVDVNSATNTVYIANAGSNTVSVLSGVSNAVVATISVGNHPSAVAVNPSTNMVYVANSGDGTVSVIAGATNSVSATISMGANGINLIAIDPGLNKIYVGSNQGYAQVINVIDGASNSVGTAINLKNAPQSIAVDSAAHILYAESNETTASGVASTTQIDVIDEASSSYVATIPLAGFVDSRGFAVNPSTSLLYAADNASSALNVLKQYAVAATVPYASSGSVVDSLSINTATNTLYSFYSQSSSSNIGMQVVNGSTNATVANISIQ